MKGVPVCDAYKLHYKLQNEIISYSARLINIIALD